MYILCIGCVLCIEYVCVYMTYWVCIGYVLCIGCVLCIGYVLGMYNVLYLDVISIGYILGIIGCSSGLVVD